MTTKEADELGLFTFWLHAAPNKDVTVIDPPVFFVLDFLEI